MNAKAPRALFLTLYPEVAASPRYRVEQFLPYLRARGFDCTLASALASEQYARLTGLARTGRALWYHLAETRRRIGQLLTARRYDVVFVDPPFGAGSAQRCVGLLGASGLLAPRAHVYVEAGAGEEAPEPPPG